MPIILAVAFISLLSAANREVFIPQFRSQLIRRPQDPLGDMPQSLDYRIDNETDVMFGGKYTYAETKRIEEPVFSLPSTLSKYGKQLTASNAYYRPPQGDRPGGYLFDGVHEPKNLENLPSLALNGKPILITPHDAPDWLKPNQCFLRSNVDFDQLTSGHVYKQLASISQLIAGLRNPSLDFGLEVRVAIHCRIVQPLLDITLLFLGLPLVVGRENRNVFIAMGLCMALTAAFIIVGFVTQQMGVMAFGPFTPALAAWAPLMIFVPPAVGLAGMLWK
jgi:lipopolysaccharide export system permease protein